MVLARAAPKLGFYATICTIGSVIGGVVGYAIGYFLYETLGQWLINAYGLSAQFEAYRAAYNDWGLWIILIKGATPIPYKLVTIASGAAAFDFWVFIAASIVTRGARFFLVAALLYWFGEPIRRVHRAPAYARDDCVRGASRWRFCRNQVSGLSHAGNHAARRHRPVAVARLAVRRARPRRRSCRHPGGAGIRAHRRLYALPAVSAAALCLLPCDPGAARGSGTGPRRAARWLPRCFCWSPSLSS